MTVCDWCRQDGCSEGQNDEECACPHHQQSAKVGVLVLVQHNYSRGVEWFCPVHRYGRGEKCCPRAKEFAK